MFIHVLLCFYHNVADFGTFSRSLVIIVFCSMEGEVKSLNLDLQMDKPQPRSPFSSIDPNRPESSPDLFKVCNALILCLL